MIHVKIAGLTLSNMGFVVLLRGEGDPRTLPIFIGGAEAQSIALQLDKVAIPRPMTHDLLKNVLDCLECRLKRVVISDLVESTFYAVLVMERDGLEVEVDARPSDAVALAMRCGAPLYVTVKVMNKAGVVLDEKGPDASVESAPSKAATSLLDQLKAKLEQAIADERYEDAATLRDKIRKLEESSAKN